MIPCWAHGTAVLDINGRPFGPCYRPQGHHGRHEDHRGNSWWLRSEGGSDCSSGDLVPVESVLGEVVAHLCTWCDAQIDAAP